jgi:hypothetical protein
MESMSPAKTAKTSLLDSTFRLVALSIPPFATATRGVPGVRIRCPPDELGGVKSSGPRQLIEQGVPGKVPGFRYDLEPKQIDDIIAYLRTGAV